VPLLINVPTATSVNIAEFKVNNSNVARISPTGQIATLSNMAVGAVGITPTNMFQVTLTSATNIGAVVRGAASQSANLQEWQNSAGTVLARVASTGAVMFGNGNMSVTEFGAVFAGSLATNVGRISMAEANSGGRLTITRQTAADANPGANVGRIYFRDGTNAGTLKLVVRAGAAGAETTILDNIPQ
jgi:hypothetical protein